MSTDGQVENCSLHFPHFHHPWWSYFARSQEAVRLLQSCEVSRKIEIEGMKGELESLHADLGARNHIIKEMATQLTEGQTQFVENIGAVERLQMELDQNQDKMAEMRMELNKKTNDLSRLQNELGTDFLNQKFSTSTLFSKDIP